MSNAAYAGEMGDANERLSQLGYERGKVADLANHYPMVAEAFDVLGFGDHVGLLLE
ncbi:hypothetical protein [Mycobacterium paraterrae]|uniref:Uncharacterized protein n=1 Tax=Mycobacterium paraterrae TaxID=577492 RepID=A0ABY3VL00_9MYCO|nr:hypothetical protein [Mycobacterium paraterrae]UMB70094.1 hypothetical protein MKK62_01715 [Mycobacterium paraterrae]